MSILTVGTGREYETIGAAVAASKAGDTIDVNAGTYTAGDFSISHDLTLVVVGGTVDVSPADQQESAQSNGAGIRYQSGNLTLDDDSFVNNQDGILAGPFVYGTGTVDVNDCVFDHNGAGDGQSHNMYIGFINTFIMTNSISEDAVVGHEVKSRAENNTIEDNQILDGPTGTASYSIDLENGGDDIIQGNTIEKGPDASAPIAIHVGGPEGPYIDTNVVIEDNTFINNYGPSAQLVNNEFTAPVTVTDNMIKNFDTILNGIGTQSGNVSASGNTVAASTSSTPPGDAVYTINLSQTSGTGP